MSESFAIDCILDGSLPAKERVSSLAVHGEKIYLGHTTGGLSIFRLPPSSASFTEDNPAPEASSSSSSSASTASPKARLISTHPTFHANGKQVLNLRIVPSLSLIFSSCTDGVLHCNSLATLESVKIPTPIQNNAPKGITAFEVQTSVVAWPRDDEEASKKAGPSASRGGSRFGARQPGMGGTLPRNSSAASVISSTGKARPLSSFIRQDSNRSVAAPKPNLRLVTILVVALRRKVVVVRWVDGQPWDWRELISNHTPRSIAFAPPDSASTDGDATRNPSSNVFLSYGTATDFGILEVPLAFKSSAAKSQHLDFAADEKRDFPRDEGTSTWKKIKDLTVPEYAGTQAEAGGTSSRAQSPAPSSSDHHSLKGLSEPPLSAKAAVAQTSGGGYLGLGGLGGYIGLGGRSKPPVIRAVPRSTAAGKVIGEGSDSSGNMEDELVVLRDTNAVFLSFKTGNPTRRRGIEWPASVDDVALLPSQHLCAALPSTSQQVKPSIQLRSLRSLDIIQTVTLPPESATPATASKGKASQASTSYSISTLFAPPATASSTSTSSPLYLVLTPNNSTEAVRLYKLTARPWRARLKEMLRTKQWERAVELVRAGLTDGELEAEGNEAAKEPSTGSHIRKRLLPPLLSLLALDRFMSGCASSVKKQMAAGNASFEAAVDLWIELNINPAKVLCIFPERIAGNGLSRPSKDWVQIWGEDLTQEGFDLRDVRWQGQDARQSSGGTKADTSSDSSPFASLTSPKPVRAVSSTGGTKLSQIFGGRPVAATAAVDTSRSSSPAQKSDAGAAEVNKTTGKAASDSPAGVAPSSSDGSGVQQSGDSQMESSRRPSIVQDDSIAPVESAEEAALTSRPALEALGRFLADRRRIFKPILETRPKVSPSPDSTMLSLPSIPLPDMTLEDLTTLARVVDTALFKTFLETKPGLVGPLCRIENWCEVTEVEELLEAKGKSSELISLYGGKNMHGKALKLLKKFADEEDDEEEKVGPTIRYLQSLGPEHIKVILENAKWVLQEDRKRGMEIFTADTGKVSSLPRLEIINLLWSFDQDLCAEYLEHVIGEVKEADPEVHEKLALIYLSRVKKQQKAGGVASQQKSTDEERLLQFLIDSEQYRPERILAQLPFNSLWEVRAVLLGRMGQHRGALAIYVERIGGDIGEQKAEEYCQTVYAKAKDDEERNIFLTLLKLHLQPALDKLQGSDDEGTPASSDAKVAASTTAHELGPALRLLSRHPSSLDLSSVLNLLPPLLTLSSLSTYLSKALQSTHRTHHNHRVLAQITKERHLQLEEKITLSKRKKVLIPPGRTCGVCGKRLGVSVLSVDVRSGEVVHYGCRVGQQQRQQQGQGLRE